MDPHQRKKDQQQEQAKPRESAYTNIEDGSLDGPAVGPFQVLRHNYGMEGQLG
jgi:hypothetical protein